VPLYKGQARAKTTSIGIDGQRHEVIEQVILLGLDDSSMVGAPPPQAILAGSLQGLRKPGAGVVAVTRLRKLYPGENWKEETKPGQAIDPKTGKNFYERFLGRELEMNDHRAVIVGVCVATRTFQSNAVVYTTFSRAKLFAPQERKTLSYVLAKAEEGVSPDVVARRIKAQ